MVELVQDHGTAPSCGARAVCAARIGPASPGLHRRDLDDVTERLLAGGHTLAMTARTSNTRFHFIDAVATLGHMIELYEDSDRIRAFYEMVRAAADGWDGSDPIRELPS
jgi:hypothetical protein